MPESGFFARLIGLSFALALMAGPFPLAVAKNHSPLPEVIMLEDEIEEILPPAPKQKGAQAKPTPTPDPIEEEDQDAEAAASQTPDLDRIPVREEPAKAPARRSASAVAAPAVVPAAKAVATPPVKPAPQTTAKPVAAPNAESPAPQVKAQPQMQPKPAVTTKTPPVAKPAPTAKTKAAEAAIFGATGDAQLPQKEATAPVETAPVKPANVESVAVPPAPEKSVTAPTTETTGVTEAPAVAAPSGGFSVKPKAADAVIRPAAADAALDPQSVRDPLAPPAMDEIVIDPAKVPRVLPEKAGTASPPKKAAKEITKKKPKSAMGKKPAARKAASTAKRVPAKKAKTGGVFEKAPAAALDDNPDAPYRDPSLDQEGEDDVEEYSEPEREPADEGDVRTFRDTISSVVDFNQNWEVNFVKNGRYRIRGQPNEIFDYQQSGQYLEVQVLESERRILSIQPIKVRFRQIR